jgi:CRISPR/Cas system-associated protein Cas7 (RAMP superfamily)
MNEPIIEGLFRDSYGKPVKHGDTIVIEENYNFHQINNQQFIVKWHSDKGMYRYHKLVNFETIGDDFYGIEKFRVII